MIKKTMGDEKDIGQMVKEMHNALLGDEFRKEGLVHKVESHEVRIRKMEKYIVGITAISGFVLFLIKFGKQILEWL